MLLYFQVTTVPMTPSFREKPKLKPLMLLLKFGFSRRKLRSELVVTKVEGTVYRNLLYLQLSFEERLDTTRVTESYG
jgi:hypothetical protein